MKDLLGKAPVLAFAKDLEGRYLYVNDAWLCFCRFTADEVLGKTDEELFPPDFARDFVKNDRFVAETAQTIQVEERAPKDGGVAVAVSTKFALRDSSGKVTAVGGIAVDITEKHRAQESLEASELRYRGLVEHSPEALVVFDVENGRFVESNENAERLFGMSRDEILRASPAQLSPPTQPDGRASIEVAMEYIQAALRGETPVFEWIHQAADGRLLPCRIWLARVDIEEGPGVRASILDMREIERVRATLERTRAQLDAVQDSLPQLVVVFEPARGAMAHCNRTYQTLAPQVPLWEAAADACRLAQKDGSARQEVELTDANGVSRSFVVDVSVFTRESSGTVRRLLLVAHDVTGQRELDAQLRESRRLESLGRLAGGVAHDFNNLLTVILGSTEFLESAVRSDEDARADLATLTDAAKKAQQITSQLLTFARSTRGNRESLAVDAQLEESVRLLQRLIGEELAIELDLRANNDRIFIDRGQFEQILMNLAANARDAMSPGDTLTISTQSVEVTEADASDRVKAGHYVQLCFKDSGSGMSPDIAEKAFDPFFTTKTVGRGTGLGLSTVHGIVQAAGGRITLESKVDEGSVVRMLLPIYERSTHESSPHAAPGEPGSTNSSHPPLRILLVEDNPAVLNVNHRALKMAGHEVSVAADGETALQLARSQGPFDLVVTDVVMPGISGFELAETLRKTAFTKRFVFVSGYAEEALHAKGLAASEVNILQKPFSPAKLVEHVHTVARGSTMG